MRVLKQVSLIEQVNYGLSCLARVHFIGRVSLGDLYLIGEKVGEIKFLLSDRAKCELQARFVG